MWTNLPLRFTGGGVRLSDDRWTTLHEWSRLGHDTVHQFLMKNEYKPWIGVDFDGTLAVYDGWKGPDLLGSPIPLMVDRVKKWLAEGADVRIVTARVGPRPLSPDDLANFQAHQKWLIQDWCLRHIGQKLPVTATKDFQMSALWDDRAIQVVPNSGVRADGGL